MEISLQKKLDTFVTVIIIFISIFSLNTPSVEALTCKIPKNVFLGAYEQGTFVDGFSIKNKETGNTCDSRPIVSEDANDLQSIFSIASQNLNQEILSGVYQLATICPQGEWKESCAESTTLTQLSNNSADLAQYKLEWQQKQQDEFLSITVQNSLVVIVSLVILTLAIFWPWIFIKIRRNLREKLSLLLIIAILLQACLTLILFGSLFVWDNGLGQLFALISMPIFGLTILTEIVFLIVRKIKSKNVFPDNFKKSN